MAISTAFIVCFTSCIPGIFQDDITLKLGGRTVAREAKHVGYFHNTTEEMQLHLHCRIQLVNAFAVTVSEKQYLCLVLLI